MNSEESFFNPDHVEMALLKFYKDPANRKLNDYLIKAQQSTSAWTFVWTLLRTEKHSEVQFYGARTLHLKISKHWQEIPADFVLPLRDRLFQLLTLYSDTRHRIVLKKLCFCIGCFILQTVTRQWSNALDELIAYVVNPPGENINEKSVCQKNLLEILRTIPEEFLNSRLLLSDKAQVLNELMNASNNVYELINKILAEDCSEKLKIAAVKCFTSWCHSDIYQFQPDNESLLIHLFSLLKSEKYSLEAADAIAQFFKLLPNPNNSRIMKYLQLVTELGSFFEQQSHNIDLAQILTKVFISAAGNNIELLLFSINTKDENSLISLALLHLVMGTVSVRHQYPTEELCSDLSLDFWLTVHDKVIDGNYPLPVEIKVRDLLLSLIKILTTKIRYPPENVYSQWGEEEKEQFLEYRQYLANFAGNVTILIGYDLMEQMVEDLRYKISYNLNAEWQDFESIFFIMSALMESGNIEELDNISEIYNLLPQIPCNNLTLTKEIIKFVGYSSGNVDDKLFDQTVAFVLNFFNQKALLASASESLKDILFDNTKRISRVSEVVIRAIKQEMEKPDIETSISKTMVFCLGRIVSILPQNHAFSVIQVIMMPHMNVLCNLAITTQMSKQDQIIGIAKLEIMTNFFLAISLPNKDISSYCFIFEFVTHILPYVEQMITSNGQNEAFIIEVFKLLKMIALSLVPHFERMVSKFCEIVQVAYSLNTLPCVIQLAEILFVASNGESKHWEALKTMYFLICEKSLQVIGQNPDENPDLVTSFMSYMCKSSKKVKDFIKLDPTCLPILFRAAMRGIEMTNVEASRSSLQFLKAVIQNNDLIRIIKTEGQRLLEILLLGVAVNFPIDNLTHVADVIIILLDKDCQFVLETLTLILFSDRFNLPLSNQEQKEQFLKILSDSNIDEMKIRKIVRELALLWRNIPDPDSGESIMYLR